MQTLTIARATWREAIRQPVSLVVLAISAAVIFLSQFINFYHFDLDGQTSHNAIRQMSVAQTLICGIVIAVFSASAALADEIENRTMVTLLAKPVRRYQAILGKFLGIMLAVALSFVIMMGFSLATAWWAEAEFPKWRVNPVLAAANLPAVTTGQSTLLVGNSYADLWSKRDGQGLDYLISFGDLLLLSTGQTSQLLARAPLAATLVENDGPFPHNTVPSVGLASMIAEARDLLGRRTSLLLQAFLLAFVQVMLIAAVAIAVSTRLPLMFNALFCTAVFVVGNLASDLGQTALSTDTGGGPGGLALRGLSLLAAGTLWLLPNFRNFDLTEALAVGLPGVGTGVWVYGMLYGIVYIILALGIAVLLFQRREVA